MGYISEMRKYIGHSPIMATSVMCIIYDKEKGILFEKSADFGVWCVPGGALEIGESLEEGLKREVKEETSLEIYSPKLLDVRSNIHIVYPNKDEVYYTEVIYEVNEYKGKLKPDAESIELKWFQVDELPDNISPIQIGIIENYIDNLKRKFKN